MSNEFPIDLVLTYVDNTDPTWQQAIAPYAAYCDTAARYRSYGLLKFCFRCIGMHMPFIRRVHLVVSNIEQVPQWLNKSKVNIVLHKDIIPKHLLPTFNSTTIEMFLHKIPRLAEHFIYSNDDLYVVKPLVEDEFYIDGKPAYELMFPKKTPFTICDKMLVNSYMLASRCLGIEVESIGRFHTIHSMIPMLKSTYEKIHSICGDEIASKCSKFREPFNYTQTLYSVYNVLSGNCAIRSWPWLSCFNLCHYAEFDIKKLMSNGIKVISLMDTDRLEDVDECQMKLVQEFEKMFPAKSRFEI